VESIEEVFWIGSPDWNEIFYISPAYEKVWGRSCESLVEDPLSWLEAIIDEDRQRVSDYITEKTQGELDEVTFPEYRITRPDGEQRWIAARGFPIPSEQGEVDRIVGIAEDITERKWAHEALQQSEVFLNSIIEQTPYAMWISDEDGTLIRLNQACCNLLNITEEEVIGKYNVLNDSIVREQGLLPLVQSVFEEGKTVHFEVTYSDI
jgi:PAS domain S-box-containing protein